MVLAVSIKTGAPAPVIKGRNFPPRPIKIEDCFLAAAAIGRLAGGRLSPQQLFAGFHRCLESMRQSLLISRRKLPKQQPQLSP